MVQELCSEMGLTKEHEYAEYGLFTLFRKGEFKANILQSAPLHKTVLSLQIQFRFGKSTNYLLAFVVSVSP